MQLTINNNLFLGFIEMEHAEQFFALIDDNRPHLREWLGWVDDLTSEELVRKSIMRHKMEMTYNERIRLGIWLNHQLVGTIGLHHMDVKNKKASIGYWLDKNAQGSGIMLQACRRIIDFAFDELNLNRVEIYCAEANAKSRKIPEKLGFILEGRLRDAHFLNDRFIDHMLYAMLQRDWKPVS